MRSLLVATSLLLGSVTSAHAQVSVSIALPGVNIGVNQPVYPELVAVPGYPVYYAPRANANYFFYDGAYWVYAGDGWYTSGWYNGPWHPVRPEYVPYYVLRVPVRYYRRPPPYFRGWHADAPPRWGQHWGPGWERNHHGWDRWDRAAAPRPAPLPAYQRAYAGDRYPAAPEHQHQLRAEHYRYEPREDVTRAHFAPPGQVNNPGQHRGWGAEPQRNAPPPAPVAAPYGHGQGHGEGRGQGHGEGHGQGHGEGHGQGHGDVHEQGRGHDDERGHGR